MPGQVAGGVAGGGARWKNWKIHFFSIAEQSQAEASEASLSIFSSYAITE